MSRLSRVTRTAIFQRRAHGFKGLFLGRGSFAPGEAHEAEANGPDSLRANLDHFVEEQRSRLLVVEELKSVAVDCVVEWWSWRGFIWLHHGIKQDQHN